MFTLALVAASFVASCLATAGLIASTQNNEEAASLMSGLDSGRDINV